MISCIKPKYNYMYIHFIRIGEVSVSRHLLFCYVSQILPLLNYCMAISSLSALSIAHSTCIVTLIAVNKRMQMLAAVYTTAQPKITGC
jgi:hypothetical protein